MRSPHPPKVLLSLAAAVVAISAGGVLAVMAGDLPAASIGFWRVALAGLMLSPALLSATGREGLDRRVVVPLLLGGLCLALHFWTWIASLQRISVMRSVVLVTLAPLWVGLMEWKVEGRAPSRPFWLGVLTALAGVVLMGLGSTEGLKGGDPIGDGLALVGGILSSTYLMIGRRLRQRVSAGAYGALVCGSAALWLLPIALISGPIWGFGLGSWAALLGMAIGPQILGHIGFAYAMRTVKASLVATLILLEPVGATLLGMLLLDQYPQPAELGAGALILVGVAIASRSER